jgi:glycosyltransferase involved in cell wall biosynthesis
MPSNHQENNRALNNPLVSIIVITYNQEPYVEAAVRSCLRQTYANIEVIVSDDASKDRTVALVEELMREDDRIRLFTAPENRGITANVQNALANCRGKYIAFLGGDDLIYPEKIERQVECMESDDQIALCFTQCHVIHGLDLTPVRVTASTSVSDVTDGYALAGSFGVEIPGPAPMVRASMVPPEGFRSLAPVASDWLFFIETSYKRKCKLIKEPLAAYRIHANNIGKNRYNYIRDYIRSYEFLSARFSDDARLIRSVKSAVRRYLLGTYYASIVDGRPEASRQVVDQYKDIFGFASAYVFMALGYRVNLSRFLSALKPLIKKLV